MHRLQAHNRKIDRERESRGLPLLPRDPSSLPPPPAPAANKNPRVSDHRSRQQQQPQQQQQKRQQPTERSRRQADVCGLNEARRKHLRPVPEDTMEVDQDPLHIDVVDNQVPSRTPPRSPRSRSPAESPLSWNVGNRSVSEARSESSCSSFTIRDGVMHEDRSEVQRGTRGRSVDVRRFAEVPQQVEPPPLPPPRGVPPPLPAAQQSATSRFHGPVTTLDDDAEYAEWGSSWNSGWRSNQGKGKSSSQSSGKGSGSWQKGWGKSSQTRGGRYGNDTSSFGGPEFEFSGLGLWRQLVSP